MKEKAYCPHCLPLCWEQDTASFSFTNWEKGDNFLETKIKEGRQQTWHFTLASKINSNLSTGKNIRGSGNGIQQNMDKRKAKWPQGQSHRRTGSVSQVGRMQLSHTSETQGSLGHNCHSSNTQKSSLNTELTHMQWEWNQGRENLTSANCKGHSKACGSGLTSTTTTTASRAF